MSHFRSWKYRVLKKWKHRAEAFRQKARTVEGRRAWSEVLKWIDSILMLKRLNKNGVIHVLHEEHLVCPHCGRAIEQDQLKWTPIEVETALESA